VCTGCDVYICDFHREQSWERWTSTSKHGVSDVKDQVLAFLRRIAHAPTPAAYKEAVDKFTSSSLWTSHPRLQQWFQRKWHPQHKVRALSVLHMYLNNIAMYTFSILFNSVDVHMALQQLQ